mmetsp:Transcript_2444/g.7585  ORF Transcript_2444/g.7585 Transcript_2444/m.7585 type:complete len:417 (+) Transcript_2444:114-1364(+)
MMKLLGGVLVLVIPRLGMGYPTDLECSRPLEVGEEIMGEAAVSDTSLTMEFLRDDETVECGGTYVPGETLTAAISDSSGIRFMLNISGGTFSNVGEECENDDSCGDTRCGQSDEVTGEATVTAPSDGSDLSVFAAWATTVGTVYLTDSCVLTAGSTEDTSATSAPSMVEVSTMAPTSTDSSLLEIASSADDLTTLVALLEATGLDAALSGDGTFTIFAPTDDAFAALGNVTLAALGNDTETLTEILTYHVASGEFFSTDLSDGMTIPTLSGGNLTVSISDSTVMINDAEVTEADIDASDGVLHKIDAVLIPGGGAAPAPTPAEGTTPAPGPGDEDPGVEPDAPTPGPVAGGTGGGSKKKKSSSGPNGGIIAAIVICVVVGVAAICGCGWYFSQANDKERENPEYAKPDEAKMDSSM